MKEKIKNVIGFIIGLIIIGGICYCIYWISASISIGGSTELTPEEQRRREWEAELSSSIEQSKESRDFVEKALKSLEETVREVEDVRENVRVTSEEFEKTRAENEKMSKEFEELRNEIENKYK